MKTYWHFCNLDSAGAPVMRDGTPVVIGERYVIKGRPKLCERGYHGSLRAIDALKYAPGPWVSKRPLRGVIRGEDKAVGRAFVQQPGVDVTDVLMEFARQCALDVIHLWDAPEVVIRYLETGDESMRAAACDAALGAALGATRGVIWYAARDAAWDAAWDATRNVTQDAAWRASCNAIQAQAQAATLATGQDAAWYVAKEAARAAQNRRLTRMLNDALKGDVK